jgi:hypothetical protein
MASALWVAGCGSETVRTGSGSGYLVLNELAAAKGGSGASGEYSTTLPSDVVTNGSVFEDLGRVSVSVAPKNITAPLTANNYVTLTRYHVDFVRSDGRNTQGVDVPYSFDGGMTLTVADAPVSASFVIVRAQSKLEPPLVNLRGGGGQIAISTIAQVTFYGRDQVGNDVSVSGSISVNFADWGDPSSSSSGAN